MGLKPHLPSHYPSFLLYVLDETHLTVTVATASVILYTQSAHAVYFSIGALGSSLTAKFIKKFIKSPRPPPPSPTIPSDAGPAPTLGRGKGRPRPRPTTHIRPKKTYGMPSTHSTAVTFYLVYILPLLSSPSTSPSSLSSPSSRIVAGLGVAVYWAGCIWSRVELGYHTYAQCLGGILLGSAMAVGWRCLWDANPPLQESLQQVVDTVWHESLGRLLQ